MNKFKVILLVFGGLILSYLGAMIFRSISVEDQLTELRTDHFVLSYRGIHKEEAQDIADSLENNYDRIRSNLNDPDHETIRVFIHQTQDDFSKATGLFE